MFAVFAAAAMLAHATTPSYRPVRVGVLVCQNASLTPLARLSQERPAWFPEGGETVQRNAGCIPLLSQAPVFVDFFEDVAWRGMVDGREVHNVARLARGRMPLENGTDLYFYVPAGDLAPIDPPAP
jgi:hypothetical protein